MESDLNNYDLIGYELPTGVGKSYIARAIQRSIKTDILTASNVLIDQYVGDYTITAVKGKTNYKTSSDYHKARVEVLEGSDGIFNPLSYFYFRKANPSYEPDCILIDEAHKLPGIIHHLSNITIDIPTNKAMIYLKKKVINEWDALECLQARLSALASMIKFCSTDIDTKDLLDHYNHTNSIFLAIKENPQDFTFNIEKNQRRVMLSFSLTISATKTPKSLLATFLDAPKTILLSGTYPQPLFEDIACVNKKVHRQIASPIDPGKRPIFADFLSEENRNNPKLLAQEINKIFEKTGKKNTVIHASYSLAAQLAKYLPSHTLIHNKKTKKTQLENFKKTGGLLLACGMAEGIDLPGKLCEVIIIPSLLYPNRGDDFVQKRIGLSDGADWYNLNTLITTIQQVGRGCRGPDDYCESYILDHLFGVLVSQYKKYLDDSFFKSIIWTGSK